MSASEVGGQLGEYGHCLAVPVLATRRADSHHCHSGVDLTQEVGTMEFLCVCVCVCAGVFFLCVCAFCVCVCVRLHVCMYIRSKKHLCIYMHIITVKMKGH